MKFSFSGELSDLQKEDLIPDKYSKVRHKISDVLNQKLHHKHYGEAIDKIFLAPMILQNDNSFFQQKKERKLIKHKERVADFRLRIDYLKFASSDDTTREKLLLKNVIDAVRIIQKRLKKHFNGEELERDILSLWDLKYSDLEIS
jgi:hypothetical protein